MKYRKNFFRFFQLKVSQTKIAHIKLSISLHSSRVMLKCFMAVLGNEKTKKPAVKLIIFLSSVLQRTSNKIFLNLNDEKLRRKAVKGFVTSYSAVIRRHECFSIGKQADK
jgi:hypothetical protein